MSQAWITIHIWFPSCERLAKTEKLFATPMYSAALTDQSICMNRTMDQEVRCLDDYFTVSLSFTFNSVPSRQSKRREANNLTSPVSVSSIATLDYPVSTAIYLVFGGWFRLTRVKLVVPKTWVCIRNICAPISLCHPHLTPDSASGQIEKQLASGVLKRGTRATENIDA